MADSDPQRDPRAAEPPADGDERPDRERVSDRPSDEPGPRGNPELDEEGLANEQQRE